MWPWQRARPAERPATGEAAGGYAARAPGWPAMPPIQRTIDPLPPVAPREEFAASLMSWRNPSFLAPLGHLVSDEAPSGVIHRLIEPAGTPAAHPASPPLSFANRPARPGRSGAVVQRMLAAFPGREPEGEAPDERASDPAGRQTAPQAAPISEPVPVVRVQRAASSAAPLTQAPPPVLPVLELAVLPAEPAGDDPPVDRPGGTLEAPTLGTGPPLSAAGVGTADDRRDGSADAAGETPPGRAPLPEPVDRPALFRADVARPVAAPSPGTMPVTPVQREVRSAAPPTERARGSAEQARPEAAHPPEGTAQPLEGTVAPLLGASTSMSVQRKADPTDEAADGPPAASSTALPTRPVVPAWVATPVRRAVGATETSRRLGLGPPLGSDALTLQRHPAAAVPVPPAATAASGPSLPPPLQQPSAITEETAASGSQPPDDETIAPLVGQWAPTAVQRAAPPADQPAASASPASSTALPPPPTREPVVQQSTGSPAAAADTARVPPPPSSGPGEPLAVAPLAGDRPALALPVLRIAVSGPRTPDNAAPPSASPPVVARLVGDRTPPLLTAPPAAGSASRPAARPLDAAPDVQATVQRIGTQPHAGNGRVDQQPGAAGNGGAWLPTRAAGSPAAGSPAAGSDVQRATGVPSDPIRLPPPVVPSAPPVVQTTPVVPSAPPVVPSAPPVVQTQDAAPALPEPASADVPDAPGPSPQPGQPDQGTPPGAPAAAGGAAAEPEELAKKLFDPLLRRIKTELRLDRERRGMLTDLRH